MAPCVPTCMAAQQEPWASPLWIYDMHTEAMILQTVMHMLYFMQVGRFICLILHIRVDHLCL